jgi:hypothetical protein
MTEQQFLLLVSVMWVAPHVPRDYAFMVAMVCLMAACVKGMGLI